MITYANSTVDKLLIIFENFGFRSQIWVLSTRNANRWRLQTPFLVQQPQK